MLRLEDLPEYCPPARCWWERLLPGAYPAREERAWEAFWRRRRILTEMVDLEAALQDRLEQGEHARQVRRRALRRALVAGSRRPRNPPR